MQEHAELDWETFSEAGFYWSEERGRYVGPPGAREPGISAVGTAAYCEHPTTDILTMSYRLPGMPVERWRPGLPPPVRLFAHIAAGGLVEAHKSIFEWLIWWGQAMPRYGFPPLPLGQMRCSMAKARVNSLPGALGDLSRVLQLPIPKDADGKRILKKLSVPQTPTKKQPLHRITRVDDPAEFERLDAYCDTDLDAERGASTRTPDMSYAETLMWLVDQEINTRGICIDRENVRNCIAIMDQAFARYGAECRALTGGIEPTQLQQLAGFLAAHGVHMPSMDANAVEDALGRPDLPPIVRRVLEIRELIGSASVKKLYAMENYACRDDRLRDLIQHHAARTGRPGGEGPQPLNLPKAGPQLAWCAAVACGRPFHQDKPACPWCGASAAGARKSKWSFEAVESALVIVGYCSLELLEWYFGDALLTISGCVRSMFIAGPGMELIASDYTAIEAVVIACLAGEQWRIDAFREGKPIYLLSASKITDKSVEYYETYKAEHGDHHEDRQQVGKISELSLGFGGWVAAWRKMEEKENVKSTYSDEDVKTRILSWRDESPAIVEFWGGQSRGLPWDDDCRPERFGLEGAAVNAISYPGQVFSVAGIDLFVRQYPQLPWGDALIMRLRSGRELTYHCPRLVPSQRKWKGPGEQQITYMTWNTNPLFGAHGWICTTTYAGKLAENAVQATAHDLQRFSIMRLREAGYPIVLHVYDENVAEVPLGTSNLPEFERIMSLVPEWAEGWPVKATGGWVGHRYRKG